MSLTLYWIQAGGCGGDTMSLLHAESPNIIELCEQAGIELLWHPSLSTITPEQQAEQLEQLVSGSKKLSILCIEGSIIRGPGGTGMYDTKHGRPKKDIISDLAKKADYVVAVGTCASFGGIGAEGDVEAIGAQFLKSQKGGFLGEDFKAGSGLPVINLPGCPCHCGVVIGALTALVSGAPVPIDELHRPLFWYGMTVHQGCTRNEYHEYRVEEKDFGEMGCLFFYMGCHGPLTYGPCNKLLWNGRTSKTRVGVPCAGCMRPDFPQPYPFFKTQNIEGVPTQLPDGLNRAHYMAFKGMAAAAAPERLKGRKTRL